jgi:hypothetical protein
MLSSFSQIAIDMAKKSFMDNNGKRMSLLMEMQKINKWKVNGKNILDFDKETLKDEDGKEKIIKKMIVPKFFGEIADNKFRTLKHLDCGMDYLQDVMDNELGKTLSTKLINIKELLQIGKNIEGERSRKEHLDKTLEIIVKCNRTVNWCKTLSCKEKYGEKARYTIGRNAKKKAIEELKNINMSNKTFMLILKKTFEVLQEDTVKKFSDMVSLVLTLLYNTNSKYFLSCFKSNNVLEDKILITDTEGTENIFGNTYTIIKKCNKSKENSSK